MILADAVEQWALQNRPDLDDADKERLRLIWSTLRDADVGRIEVQQMTKGSADEAMALFDSSTSVDVAVTLNAIVKWARGGAPAADSTTGERPRPRPRAAATGGRIHNGSPAAAHGSFDDLALAPAGASGSSSSADRYLMGLPYWLAAFTAASLVALVVAVTLFVIV